MFFYPTVLNHRTGCFATVWLAATKGRKITRRDLLKVNVQRTCCDIMDYVLVRVPPPAAGLPRPRFSLYLSSQLQYGVVLVYYRQCGYLLEDTQGAIDKLHRLNQKPNIDLTDTDTSHMMPDALALLDETEGARDPFFGIIDSVYGLPSPSSLIQMAQRMDEALPERALSEREPSPLSDGITASQESITMTEREPVILPHPEFEGEELQESGIIDLLLEQPDHFPEGEQQRPQEPERQRDRIDETERVREPEVPVERGQKEIESEEVREPEIPEEREQERAVLERDITPSVSLDLEQITSVSSRDVALLPEEDFGLPLEMPVLEEREKTPELVPPPLPSPPLGEEEIGIEPMSDDIFRERSPSLKIADVSPETLEVTRKRRRQLLFIDKDTQISQDEMRAQIGDEEIETKELADVLVKLPKVKQTDPKTLLLNPCMNLPPKILALWKRAAVIKPFLPSRRFWVIPEEIPEKEEQRKEPGDVELERELSSKEISKEMVESSLFQQETPASSVVLETTDKDFSPFETPEIRRSPVPALQYTLEDIPEERVPETEQKAMVIDESMRALAPLEALVTFQSLLPPQTSRRVVAQHFWRLLEETVAKQVTVQQDEPYGDIIISQVQPLIV